MVKKSTGKTQKPDPLDLEIGARLRSFRVVRGITQGDVSKVLNLSSQQIQKYECGANRLSCSGLIRLMQHYDTSPETFFDGITETAKQTGPIKPKPDEAELLSFYRGLKTDDLRKTILNLLRSLILED